MEYMRLEILLLSEVSQKLKGKDHMILLIRGSEDATQMGRSRKQKQTHRHREQTCSCQKGEGAGVGWIGSLVPADVKYYAWGG